MQVLYLCDPLDGSGIQRKIEYPNVTALVFDENERWLSKAQRFFSMQPHSLLAAEGYACAIALALAAQLPVEELMLRKCALFKRNAYKYAPAQLRRIAGFARRNLPLAAAHIRLFDTDETEIARLQNAVSRFAQLEACEPWPFLQQE